MYRHSSSLKNVAPFESLCQNKCHQSSREEGNTIDTNTRMQTSVSMCSVHELNKMYA